MSPRHFARAFTAETGITPVEGGGAPAAGGGARSAWRLVPSRSTAWREAAGFGDPERMRRAFIRAFGQPPNRCGARRGIIIAD